MKNRLYCGTIPCKYTVMQNSIGSACIAHPAAGAACVRWTCRTENLFYFWETAMTENKANAISVSLLNRKIYAVCFTELDTIAAFHDTLYGARRRFFESGKTARVRETGIYSGLSGEVRGKISRRGFKWEKRTENRVVEASFAHGSQRGIAFYDPNGALRTRIYFDREQHWLRTEYFAPDDSQRAKVSFKPDDTRDAVLRFDYSRSTGKTKETALFPVPYAFQSAEQSLQNAHCGNDALLLIATDTGEFAYCPREEQQRRIRFMKDSRNASVMLSMGWEIKDGDIAAPEAPSRDADYIFSSIEEIVRTEHPAAEELLAELFEDAEAGEAQPGEVPDAAELPGGTSSQPLADSDENESASPESAADLSPALETEPAAGAEEESPAADTPDHTSAKAPATAGEPEAAEAAAGAPFEHTEPNTDTDEALTALGITASDAARVRQVLDRILDEDSPQIPAAGADGLTLIRNGTPVRYTGQLEGGMRSGFGRTETPEGITLYEGEYKNDRREGFGAHHYKSGAVSYIGDFKDDKREGFGVSFREADHALHVSRWADGKPEGYAALFDPNGAMRFAGKIIAGQKQGAGVTIDPKADTVFVAKYRDNEPIGEGALFDGSGTLLYVGGWKDGKRNGHGVEFDSRGDVVYAGGWKDDGYSNGILYKKVQEDSRHGQN